jgi:hypothetical protein
MTQFKRGISGSAMQELAILAGQENSWFADLLALWAPSGVPSGTHGLRISIHDNQLDFYRNGNSIACITFDRGWVPSAKIAGAYTTEGGTGSMIWAGPKAVDRHIGMDVLCSWIERAQKYKKNDEKCCVDKLVGENIEVVELEMALPRQSGKSIKSEKSSDGGAKRIDLVAAEQHGPGFRLVFWEVKLSNDKRLVSNSDRPDRPEVLKQLKAYGEYLPKHCDEVLEAYQTTWQQLAQLSSMANVIKTSRRLPLITLNPWINKHENLLVDIDRVPRLVIVQDGEWNKNWKVHRTKLSSYPCLEFEKGQSMELRSMSLPQDH